MAKNPIQPAGLSAMVDAVGTCSNSFQCLDLDGITITLEIEKKVNELKESHSNISIPHGGVGGLKPPKPLLPPMAKLLKYCKENKVELLDLFRLFDKEQQLVLSEEEFRNALKVFKISVPPSICIFAYLYAKIDINIRRFWKICEITTHLESLRPKIFSDFSNVQNVD